MHDALARAGGGELLDRVLHTNAGAVGPHNVHRVAVGRARLKVVYTQPVSHIGQVRVPPIGRFRRLLEVLRVRPVLHGTVVEGRTPARIGSPSENGSMIRRRYERRPVDDLRGLGLLRGGP